MIDKKKLSKRLNKNSRLKELPLLNFYILVVVFFEIIGEGFQISWLQMFKPLPIVLMIYYIHSKNSPRDHLMPRFVEIGLVFSLIGDLFLMSNEDSSFVIGTVFFMIAHVIYILAFRMGEEIKDISKEFRVMRWGAYIIILVLLAVNIFSLLDKFINKPVFVIYSVILAAEAMITLNRYEISSRPSFFFILIGVVLFSVSDNLLGFLKFNAIKTDLGRFFIMLTYYGAQYFIMHGALHQSNLQY